MRADEPVPRWGGGSSPPPAGERPVGHLRTSRPRSLDLWFGLQGTFVRVKLRAAMKPNRLLIFLLVPFFILACRDPAPAGPPETPQAAVVAWLAAVDRGDFSAAADLAPPNLGDEAKAELERDLASRFGGARRDESTPFVLYDLDASQGTAVVRLKQAGGITSAALSLQSHDGSWHVMPVEPEESPADVEPNQ